ncbi:hypothetical protein GQ53DRAFT_44663 [Thozetella sp. PMI_491]|nr:hypothetical protein GQ53DRAFT_44663 [Thozetella sp. PMI_491]
MSTSSRKGRPISRKACDLCRERKVQCVFGIENQEVCLKCLKAEVPCTFLTERKPRGPPSRRVLEAQRRALSPHTSRPWELGEDPSGQPASPVDSAELHAVALPLGPLTVDHLVPEPIFRNVIRDYLEQVYPVLPLVHVPSFRTRFDARDYATDPPFFRLCVALCAVTTASIPRQAASYTCNIYRDMGALVDRASHMILISRMSSESAWQNSPTVGSMIVSVILSMAAHYTSRPNAGWAYASEAIHFFRTLELYKKSAYDGMTPVDIEMCKRAFWVLYIIQVHDRILCNVPHTGLSYDPMYTDWEFLTPLEVSDEHLHLLPEDYPSPSDPGHRPVISGFIALTRVFLCFAGIISKSIPGPPLSYSMASRVGSGTEPHTSVRWYMGIPVSSNAPSLEIFFNVMKRLHTALEELPDELKLPHRRTPPASSHSPDGPAGSMLQPNMGEAFVPDSSEQSSQPSTVRQFDIMRVNIHVTSLYLQSTILDLCINTLQRATTREGSTPYSNSSPASMDAYSPNAGKDAAANASKISARAQLFEFRSSLARELLDILTYYSSESLEANGESMIIKIRDIASSLLDRDEERDIAADIEERNRHYVTRFVEILAKLDYASRHLRQVGEHQSGRAG